MPTMHVHLDARTSTTESEGKSGGERRGTSEEAETDTVAQAVVYSSDENLQDGQEEEMTGTTCENKGDDGELLKTTEEGVVPETTIGNTDGTDINDGTGSSTDAVDAVPIDTKNDPAELENTS